MFTIDELFDLEGFADAELFRGCERPWDPLDRIEAYVTRLVTEARSGAQGFGPGTVFPNVFVRGAVFIAEGAVVEPYAFIDGPTYIGPETVVRHGAYVRGYVLTGRGCVIGHASEVVRSIFLDGAKAPHFNYVGDSILGKDVNLGAGVKLANLKLSGRNVRIDGVDTCRRKFGAIIGDDAQLGCNGVCSPGTILARGALVMPNVTVPPGCHTADAPHPRNRD